MQRDMRRETASEETPGFPDLRDYPVTVEIPVRWGDMDAFGHVNNTLYFRYFEVARVAYFDAIGFRDATGVGPILAETSCRFRRPLRYPDTVHVGARTAELDEDRFTHEYLIVSESLGEVAGIGRGLVVSYDYGSSARAPLPPRVRRRIENMMAARD